MAVGRTSLDSDHSKSLALVSRTEVCDTTTVLAIADVLGTSVAIYATS